MKRNTSVDIRRLVVAIASLRPVMGIWERAHVRTRATASWYWGNRNKENAVWGFAHMPFEGGARLSKKSGSLYGVSKRQIKTRF
jgi:hypothetical protein